MSSTAHRSSGRVPKPTAALKDPNNTACHVLASHRAAANAAIGVPTDHDDRRQSPNHETDPGNASTSTGNKRQWLPSLDSTDVQDIADQPLEGSGKAPENSKKKKTKKKAPHANGM